MLFCDIELARRIERAEVGLLEAACSHVRGRLPDLFLQPVGGGLAACTEPGSPLNKVCGLGFEPLDERAWSAVEAEFARRAVPVQVELSTLADGALGDWLTGRGFRLVGVENVLGRPLTRTEVFPLPGDVRVDESGPGELEAWIDLTVTGFAAPDVEGVASHEVFERALLERVLRDLSQGPGFVRYLARRGRELAGTASMRTSQGLAQLCGATTLPLHRRRGVQSALLAQRLGAAARAGCTLAVVTTQPGSKSQQNMHKQGFELLYSRNVLRR